MSIEDLNNYINKMNLEEKIDLIYSILYDIEDYLDYENETIDKILKLLDNEPIFH